MTPLQPHGRGGEIAQSSSLLRSTESLLRGERGGDFSVGNSQSFANQTLMMESRGEPFLTSFTAASFRQGGAAGSTRREREEALRALDRTAALRREAAHRKKRSFNEMREAIGAVSLHLDTYESTFFETEIIRRHLLEAAVMLRFCQSQPVRRRDARLYLGLPPHMVAPHTLRGQHLENLTSADKDEDQRRWTKFTFSQNEFGNALRPDPADLFSLYVHNKTGRVQRGVPFDVKMRDWTDNELKTLRWYTHGKVYSNARKSKKTVTLLADKYRGVLFHCPLRKVFDWKEQMDYSYYDPPPKVKSKRKKGPVLGRPENKVILQSDSGSSGSDSDGEGELTSARKKKLKETLQALAAQGEAPVKTSKAARMYKSLAAEEHRSLNIWADLDMTKSSEDRGPRLGGALGLLSGSTLCEESTQSTNTSARNPGVPHCFLDSTR